MTETLYPRTWQPLADRDIPEDRLSQEERDARAEDLRLLRGF
jgi:hypothetical protein